MTDEWEELADHVYQRSYDSWNVNVGVVRGDERTALIDTRATPQQGLELRESIRLLTDQELVVINTHAHRDHYLGNSAFSSARVLAHPAAIATMRSDWAEAGIEVELPEAADPTPSVVDLGGRSLRITHPGLGHTDGDLVIEVLGSGVAFAGDLIRQDAPLWYGDSHPMEWPATLAHMLRLGSIDTWVPGHGRPMGEEDVREQATFAAEVAALIGQSWSGGLTVATAASHLPLSTINATHAINRGYERLTANAAHPS